VARARGPTEAAGGRSGSGDDENSVMPCRPKEVEVAKI
jgi:hypothetical protein